MDLLRRIDFLSFKPTLLVRNQDRYQNLFGGIISLTIILLSIVCAIYFGLELFYKSVPNVIVSKKTFTSEEVGPYLVGDKEFSLYVGIQHRDTSYYIDKTVFQVSAQEIIHTVKGETITKELNIGQCDKLQKFSEAPESYWVLPWNNFFCITANSTSLYGSWGSGQTSSLMINVDKCTNSSQSSVICRPQEEIDQFIQGGYVGVVMKTNDVYMEDYENPFHTTLFINFNLINAIASVEYNIALYPMEVESDNGFILPSKIKEKRYYSEFARTFYNLANSGRIFSLTAGGYNSGLIYKRTYIKFQDLLTKIGGLIKMLMIIGTYIVVPLTTFLFRRYTWEEICSKSITIPSKIPPYQDDKSLSMNISKKETPKIGNFFEHQTRTPSDPMIGNSIMEVLKIKTDKTNFSLLIKEKLIIKRPDFFWRLLLKYQKKSFSKAFISIDAIIKKYLSAETVIEQLLKGELLRKNLNSEDFNWAQLIIDICNTNKQTSYKNKFVKGKKDELEEI
jgi:hypothetical protein